MDAAVEKGRRSGWSQAQYKAELENIIREERSALRSGERRLNKNYRGAPSDASPSGDPT